MPVCASSSGGQLARFPNLCVDALSVLNVAFQCEPCISWPAEWVSVSCRSINESKNTLFENMAKGRLIGRLRGKLQPQVINIWWRGLERGAMLNRFFQHDRKATRNGEAPRAEPCRNFSAGFEGQQQRSTPHPPSGEPLHAAACTVTSPAAGDARSR